MATGDGDHDRMLAEAANRTIEELVRAFAEVTDGGVEVKTEAHLVFLAAYGWWAKITRTCQAIALLDKEHLPVESEPLARVVAEHTLALCWLIDGAPHTVDALEEEGEEQRRNLIESALRAEWRLPVDVAAPQLPAKGDEHPLRHELSNFRRLTRIYRDENTYVAYRMMSSQVHPSGSSARAYLHVDDLSGAVSVRDAPDGDAAVSVTHAAYCLIQAAKAINPLLAGDPLESAITRAQLLFGREADRPQRVPVPEEDPKIAPSRVSVTAPELAEARALATVVFDALTATGVTVGQVHESQTKRRVMADVRVPPAADTSEATS